MAHGTTSEQSRRLSLLALRELDRISARHPALPDPAAVGEEQAAWLSERMRSFHESVVQTGWRRFSFLPESKAVRNSLAHSTAECTQEELAALWSRFYGLMDGARHELEANVARLHSQDRAVRRFEKFGSPQLGGGLERRALAQSLQDALDPSLPEEQRLPFRDSAAARELQKFLDSATDEERQLLDFARRHRKLGRQIQGEMLSCLDSAYRDTELDGPNCPFAGEAAVIRGLGDADPQGLLAGMDGIRESLPARRPEGTTPATSASTVGSSNLWNGMQASTSWRFLHGTSGRICKALWRSATWPGSWQR